MNNFRIKTTVAFTHTILVDGTAPTLTDDDIVYFIMKEHLDDTDAQAVITKTGTNSETTDGEVSFTLTADDTDVEAGEYYYEFKWVNDTSVYITESSTVNVLKRVFD